MSAKCVTSGGFVIYGYTNGSFSVLWPTNRSVPEAVYAFGEMNASPRDEIFLCVDNEVLSHYSPNAPIISKFYEAALRGNQTAIELLTFDVPRLEFSDLNDDLLRYTDGKRDVSLNVEDKNGRTLYYWRSLGHEFNGRRINHIAYAAREFRPDELLALVERTADFSFGEYEKRDLVANIRRLYGESDGTA